MGGQRFDELARVLAGTRSRRGALKAMTGGVVAGVSVLFGQRGAVAQPECETDEDCEAGICCAGACQEIQCCIDDEDPNARCPEGTSCFEGICDPVEVACTSDADCAEGEICCADACRPIECCIDDEDPNARCPEGTSCFEGVCDPIEVPCDDDADCAAGEICCAEACRAIECCIDEADPNARCPKGTSCFEGMCDPIDGNGKDGTSGLPATGVGGGTGGANAELSAILAAGAAAAAAAVAARKLRQREAEPETAE